MKNTLIGLGIVVLLGAGALLLFSAPIDTPRDGYFYGDEYGQSEEWGGYAYTNFVDSPDDCTQYEQYDEEEGYCYYECDTEEECGEIEALIDAELDQLADEYGDFAETFQEFEGDASDLDTEVIYEISQGEQFNVVEGIETEEHLRIRRWLASISPDTFSDTYIHQLAIFSAPNSEDGAFVEPSFDGAQKWDMYVNRDVLDDSEKEMVFTLVHEFAHILTLNNSQIDAQVTESSCPRFYTDEGCARAGSYIDDFFKTFWSNGSGGYAPYYFVTEYAATNPGEDIAESFASFVLSGKTHEETVAEQKTNFFYDYSELEKMRTAMRQALTPFVRARLR